ncbi:hypothetical protein MPTK1_4g23000 [Marchantia polymorpha subsp. ruderalis]|uniref:MYND-type domain-containing protein n=2 Tax=Marchantia polymorpha TaxID=3197 RepID=A0AAF6BCU0_MARPO|nr:hypothetical protein MARPO_0020s0062 [Marchantia polymorpha]BBN09824.1 hypothetical protein Mp_4g23000 [Marchantia polymorpha subsp. ruderalis]|eukprot:PTQ44399.1 hypothetical protein MARPO_0020s0062 [Marchantia polymorpha]
MSRACEAGSSSSGSEELHVCGLCGKEGVKLRCSTCVQVYYCDRKCQLSDWKTHKPICKVLSGGGNGMKKALEVFEGLLAAVERGKGPTTASGKVPTTVRKADVSLFDDNFKWDEGLTKEEVYVRFIDSFRLRRDDDYAFGAEICEFYALGNAIPGFKDYLNQAKAKNILPSWWSEQDDRKIMIFSMSHKWANLNYAVEKYDIEDHYCALNKPFEHMVLRFLAEQITGDNPCCAFK